MPRFERGSDIPVDVAIEQTAEKPATLAAEAVLQKQRQEPSEQQIEQHIKDVADARGKLADFFDKTEATEEKAHSPFSYLPHVDSAHLQQALEESTGLSKKNEAKRSELYRDRTQVSFLRDYMNSMPPDAHFSILNIGAANGEEILTYALVAESTNKLDQMSATFVDVQPRQTVQPPYDLRTKPPEEDKNGAVLHEGAWKVNDHIKSFVEDNLNKPSNHFGEALEEFLSKEPRERYSLVTCNNVAQYLGRGTTRYDNPIYTDSRRLNFSTLRWETAATSKDYRAFQSVLLSVAEQVAPNGMLFLANIGGAMVTRNVDLGATFDQLTQDNSNFKEVFEVVNAKHGIYRRIKDEPLRFNDV